MLESFGIALCAVALRMPIPRPWLLSLFLSCASLAVSVASAAGIGAGPSSVPMGQPLDFAVQVGLEPGFGLDPRCVFAEVTVGERRLPPHLVSTAVEMIGINLARVRVATELSIEEPVLGIELSVGCQARMARRFVVLADPPLQSPPLTPVAAAARPQPAAIDSRTAFDERTPTGARARTEPSSGRDGGPGTGRRVAGAGSPRTERRAPGTRAPQTPRAGQALARTKPAAAPARLRLDLFEPRVDPQARAVQDAIEAVAQAASAARAAASAASVSAARIASLEQTVAQLRQDNQARSELVLQLRERLAQVDNTGIWMLPLLLLAGALAALAAWLAWRLAALQRQQQQAWRPAPPAVQQAAGAESTPARQTLPPSNFVTAGKQRPLPAWPPAAPVPPVPDWASLAGPPTEPDSREHARSLAEPDTLSEAPTRPQAMATAAGRPEPGAPTAPERTDVLPPRGQPEQGAPRDVSIEELIDLEQQAEFFVVLGQDDAAVDLLVEHLRTTGGGSPLPYLKLLEIHHRQGDRAAYERQRTRFNHRFNAFAPEWGADLHGGRSLEDYAGVVPRLQQIWNRPLDAMAELEALLFRKSRGELFELPAYREVLFLYSLARDLMDREATDTGTVDLLLPLSDGGEFGSTSPAPFLGLKGAEGEAPPPDFDSRPTAPVDFDISANEPASSIFGLPDEQLASQRPHRA